MTHPTTEQLYDPRWWDEHAPSGATHLIDGEFRMWTPSGDELIWREEAWRQQGLGSFSLEDYRSGCMWDVVSRPTTAPYENVSTANARWKHNLRHPKREYHPDPGTEALATWLEPPDGGDRRPERVLVKGYYTHTDNSEQVWFTTQEGEDTVHLTENVRFEPLPTVREELAQALGEIVKMRKTFGEMADGLLSKFDVSFKE